MALVTSQAPLGGRVGVPGVSTLGIGALTPPVGLGHAMGVMGSGEGGCLVGDEGRPRNLKADSLDGPGGPLAKRVVSLPQVRTLK